MFFSIAVGSAFSPNVSFAQKTSVYIHSDNSTDFGNSFIKLVREKISKNENYYLTSDKKVNSFHLELSVVDPFEKSKIEYKIIVFSYVLNIQFSGEPLPRYIVSGISKCPVLDFEACSDEFIDFFGHSVKSIKSIVSD